VTEPDFGSEKEERREERIGFVDLRDRMKGIGVVDLRKRMKGKKDSLFCSLRQG